MSKPLAMTLLMVLGLPLACAAEPTQQLVDFQRDVRPILSDKCFFCHGPDAEERQADLRLDIAAGLRTDLGGYSAVEPGKPEQSALVERITSTDPDQQMPPPDSGKSLSAEEITILKRWIAQGAPW